MASLNDVLGEALSRRHDELIDTRRWIHQHPELGHHEHGTTALIRDRLARLGLEERQPGTETGAVFVLEGNRPGPTVLLRADIDALPVHEELEVTHRSLVDGVMHACGHDGHTAMLLTVASILTDRADALDGRYAFLFQPGEECGDGARRMIDAGVLDGLGVDAAVGCHLSVGALPVGTIALRSGLAFADTHVLELEIHGRAGHSASQEQFSGAIPAAGELVGHLSDLVAELAYERVDCSCSCGAIHAGSTANVIPELAVLNVTLRTFTEEQHGIAMQRLAALTERIAEKYHVEVEARTSARLPSVDNDATITSSVRASAESILGSDRVMPAPPVVPGDDISEFLQRVPGCYFHLGATPTNGAAPHHSPRFDFDERALEVGARVLLSSAVGLTDTATSPLASN